MILVLPYPPSANAYWTIGRAGRSGRAMIIKTTEARLYQRTAGLLLRREGIRQPLTGNVSLEVTAYRPRKVGDLDNVLKVLIDALKGIVFEDDNQVVEVLARRRDDAANPRVVVTVRPEGP